MLNSQHALAVNYAAVCGKFGEVKYVCAFLCSLWFVNQLYNYAPWSFLVILMSNWIHITQNWILKDGIYFFLNYWCFCVISWAENTKDSTVIHKKLHNILSNKPVQNWFLGFRVTSSFISQELNQYLSFMILQFKMRLLCQSSVVSFSEILRCRPEPSLELLEISVAPLKSVDRDPRRPWITKNQTTTTVWRKVISLTRRSPLRCTLLSPCLHLLAASGTLVPVIPPFCRWRFPISHNMNLLQLSAASGKGGGLWLADKQWADF